MRGIVGWGVHLPHRRLDRSQIATVAGGGGGKGGSKGNKGMTSRPKSPMKDSNIVSGPGGEVALVLAEQWMPDTTGAELLARVRGLHPTAQRSLLIEWGGWGHPPTRDALLQ